MEAPVKAGSGLARGPVNQDQFENSKREEEVFSAPLLEQQTPRGLSHNSEPRQHSISEDCNMGMAPDSTAPLLRCSFFDHALDNRPKSKSLTLDQLRSILLKTYTPRIQGDKRSQPAISPAYYPAITTRGHDHASEVGLLILDFDNAVGEPIPNEFFRDPRTGSPTGRPKIRKVQVQNPVSMEEVLASIQGVGIASMAWTTWSSTQEWEKFRVIVFLSHPVPVELWERATEWALSYLGLDSFRHGLDLPVLRNAVALAFLPGCPDPRTIRRKETFGSMLDIPLHALPSEPQTLIASWQVALVAERRRQQEQGDVWWKAYRVSGRPVDFRTINLATILEARGIKVGPSKPYKNGFKRRSHCPWAEEHTGGIDDDAAVLIHSPGNWPVFHCSHSGHQHMGLRDLIEWAWGRP